MLAGLKISGCPAQSGALKWMFIVLAYLGRAAVNCDESFRGLLRQQIYLVAIATAMAITLISWLKPTLIKGTAHE